MGWVSMKTREGRGERKKNVLKKRDNEKEIEQGKKKIDVREATIR